MRLSLESYMLLCYVQDCNNDSKLLVDTWKMS
jgi:hypothetical protein